MKNIVFATACLITVSFLLVPATAIPTRMWDGGNLYFSIYQGWNLVPLKLLNHISGRYWTMFGDNMTTCNQEVLRDVWMYSPVAKRYERFVIDDWMAPNTRNNQFLQGEFNNKYFHAFYGSAWIYSSKSCRLAYDAGAQHFTNIVNRYFSGADQPSAFNEWASESDSYKDLTIKQGWNFVPFDKWMVGKSMRNIFAECTISKVNLFNPSTQQWEFKSSQEMASAASGLMNSNLYEGADFETILIKVENDCRISMSVQPTGPPPLPE